MGHKAKRQDGVDESLPLQGLEEPVGDLSGDMETTETSPGAQGEEPGGAEPESGIVAESVQENVVDTGFEPLASGGEQSGEPAVAAETSLASPPAAAHRDPRLPAVGSVIVRQYKGYRLQVAVLQDGFEFEGEKYTSISSVAKAATGHAAINGYSFFGLGAAPGGKGAHQGQSDSGRIEKRAAKIQRLIAELKAAIEVGVEVVDEAEASAKPQAQALPDAGAADSDLT